MATPYARGRGLRAAAAVAALVGCAAHSAPEASSTADQPSLDLQTCLTRTEAAAKQKQIGSVSECCAWLASYYSEHMAEMDAWAARLECCEAAQWQGGLACTPWGPPSPPGVATPSFTRLNLNHNARQARVKVSAPPETIRQAAIATWQARMCNEYASAGVFEALARQLSQAGVAASRVAQVRGFAREERTHGVLCGAVVRALGGSAEGRIPSQTGVPEHPDVSRQEAAVRNLLSVACLSETVAVALIGAEWADMPQSPLRDLLGRIWADEVGHARTGWALLDELGPFDNDTNERLLAWLRVAFAHLETHELAHLPITAEFGPEGAAWGLCNGTRARDLFYETVATVIVEGLQRRGIPARAAWTQRHA